MSNENKEISDALVQRVLKNTHYKELKRKRDRFAWILTFLILIVYYGYIGMVAFDKELLARPIGNYVATYGIPIALGVIFFTIIITGIYVHRANTEFEKLTQKIISEVTK